jgi:hypothetical protein
LHITASLFRKITPLVSGIVIVLSSASCGYSEGFSLIGQNEVRYGSGIQANRFPDNKLRYLENYLELTGTYNNFRLYIRQAYKLPSEYDVESHGIDAIDKLFAEYRTDNLTIRSGDFYRSWGKGLFFGTQEIIESNIDTGIEGLLVEGSYSGFEGAIFRGSETDSLRHTVESAEGIWLTQRLPFDFKVGAGLMNLDSVSNGMSSRHPQIDRHGFELEKDFGIGSFYGCYVSDRLPTTFTPDITITATKSRFNHALFSSGTVYGDGWSFYLDFRSYQMMVYQEYKPIIGYVVQTPLQNVPIGRPENTLYLLDHYPRALRFDDDAGFQAEYTANFGAWDLLANYHESTRSDKGGFISKHSDRYSPYEGIYLRGEYSTPWQDKLALKGGWQRDVDYDRNWNVVSHRSKRNALGLLYEHEFKNASTMTSEAQVMEVRGENSGASEKYWEEYISLTYVPNADFSFTGTLSRTESPTYANDGVLWGKDFIGGRGWYWPSLDVVLQVMEQHQLRLFYGYERGGLSCAGGVCHVVNPFKGVKVGLVSHF